MESGSKVVTEGLNPHFTTDEQFLAACATVRQQFSILNSQFSIYFYGAGCGDQRQRDRVASLLTAFFRPDSVSVETDMVGACRAVSGRRASIVAILGTGSNVCYYDGSVIRCQPTSTGYIMGDNGSANHVGRILLNDYLTQRMPEDLRTLFYETYQMSDSELMDAVYHRPNANRFLAALAPFAVQHVADDYCARVIREALYDWYHGPLSTLMQRAGLGKEEINFVGGFAKAIEPLLRNYLADDTLTVGTVLADPIEGLRNYHRIS